MMRIITIHPLDDLVVALVDLAEGEACQVADQSIVLTEPIRAKHKFAKRDIAIGESVTMYGIVVGKATKPIRQGERITVSNLVHATDELSYDSENQPWSAPDVTKWQEKSFLGFHRENGSVGTRNFWIVCPLVYCQNRNLEMMRQALTEELGYDRHTNGYREWVRKLKLQIQGGCTSDQLLQQGRGDSCKWKQPITRL